MLKRLSAITFVMLLVCTTASAATDTDSLTINCTVSAYASVTLTPSTINFTPTGTTTPTAADTTVSVAVDALTASGNTVDLDVLADGDLVDGGSTIAITNVSWTASGTGFVAGTMDTVIPAAVGSWTGSGNRTGVLTYTLAAGAYDAGNYTQTATYTLTAP